MYLLQSKVLLVIFFGLAFAARDEEPGPCSSSAVTSAHNPGPQHSLVQPGRGRGRGRAGTTGGRGRGSQRGRGAGRGRGRTQAFLDLPDLESSDSDASEDDTTPDDVAPHLKFLDEITEEDVQQASQPLSSDSDSSVSGVSSKGKSIMQLYVMFVCQSECEFHIHH